MILSPLIFVLAIVGVSCSFISEALSKAAKLTLFEMKVEDENALHKIDNHLARRLIVLPLSEAFNPSQASGMHGKVVINLYIYIYIPLLLISSST